MRVCLNVYVYYVQNAVGAIKEIMPVCVLDFYVHEVRQKSMQVVRLVENSGTGMSLFDLRLPQLEPESGAPVYIPYGISMSICERGPVCARVNGIIYTKDVDFH